MKSTTLAAAILLLLAGPASVLAEDPAVAVLPLAVEVEPVDLGSAAQQADVPVTELTGQQAVEETISEAAETAAGLVETPSISETHADAAAPETEIVDELATPEAPVEVIAVDAGASGTDTHKEPCQTKARVRLRKGMDHDHSGPGGGKPGCDRDGKERHNKHEQVVRRLDMIEARMAKMEAMLESLMQR